MIVVNEPQASASTSNDDSLNWHTINNQMNQTKGLLSLFKDNTIGDLDEKDLQLCELGYKAAKALESNLNKLRRTIEGYEQQLGIAASDPKPSRAMQPTSPSTSTANFEKTQKLSEVLNHFLQPLQKQAADKNFVCVSMLCNRIIDRISFSDNCDLKTLVQNLSEKSDFLVENQNPGEHPAIEKEVLNTISKIVDYHNEINRAIA